VLQLPGADKLCANAADFPLVKLELNKENARLMWVHDVLTTAVSLTSYRLDVFG